MCAQCSRDLVGAHVLKYSYKDSFEAGCLVSVGCLSCGVYLLLFGFDSLGRCSLNHSPPVFIIDVRSVPADLGSAYKCSYEHSFGLTYAQSLLISGR